MDEKFLLQHFFKIYLKQPQNMLICKISFRFLKNEDRIPKCNQIGQINPLL